MTRATPPRPAPARPGPSRPRPSAGPARATTIDPFRVLRRHILALIAAVFLGAGVGVGAYFGLLKVYPLYTSQVVFEVSAGIAEAGEITTQQAISDEEVLRIQNTELVLLMDRDVLTNAVSDPDVQSKTAWFQDNFMEGGAPLVAEAVDELEEDLKATVLRGTQLFEVRWSAHEQRDVPIVLNAVARAYMDKRQKQHNRVFNQNLDIFNRQLASTDLDIQDLDQEISTFIRDTNITSLDDPRYNEAAIAVQALIQQITMAQQALSISQSQYQLTAAKLEGEMEPSAEDILTAEMDFAVASHIRAEENLKFQLRVNREKFGAEHSSVIQAETLLRAAEAEKMAKRDEVVQRNLEAQLKRHASEIQSYTTMLDELEAESEIKGAKLSELAAQQSKFDALRGQREYLEASRDADRQLIREVQLMRLRADAEQVSVVQEALTPREMSFPRPELIMPLGVLLVFGFVVGIIFLREISDQRVKTASDLAVLPGARVLGVIPDREDDPTKVKSAEMVLRRLPMSVLAESYRQTCTPLGKAIDRAGHQTLVLMGGLPGAGTTTAATNIAAGLAGTGRKVLLVDANFRRPRLGEVMGLSNDQVGLGDLLSGDARLEEAVTETDMGVSVIAAGSPPNRLIERLNTVKFDSVVAEARDQFDVIIFDAAPAVVAGDAMIIANKVDAAVLVVRANQEQRGLVSRLIRQLADTQCELLGIVLNRPRGTAGGYFKKNFAAMAGYAKKS
ncbi:MAG: polysaccharide biosynthesis tyrosine autokinase [Phycisphaerales bacterium]|nr:polysaccharide biosynthesis tyrosine autokinase [Phycisphaerae bacterium]NNF42319.1 polysaccharide biosynthesis tyrosine autokinase [Phycisphaerales bacterium]NNM25702.1 polysaccharide biosynthesis tyrosine autokinase [Phycisphaerales bacterium]